MTCVRCGQAGTFTANHRVCNSCRTKQHRKDQSLSPRNYLLVSLTKARVRAKRRSTECTLVLDDLVALWKKQKGRCALTGLAMTYAVGDGKARDLNVSIDRRDSKLGYTLDNIQLVCTRVNAMKSDLDMVDFQWWVKTLNDHMEG